MVGLGPPILGSSAVKARRDPEIIKPRMGSSGHACPVADIANQLLISYQLVLAPS